jgi:hypothetical protein
MSSRLIITTLALLSWLPLASAAPRTAVGALALRAAPVGGKVFMTRDEALELAFPKCEITRGTSFLSEAEQARVAKLSGVDFESAIVHPYVATLKGKLVGTAYFDTHRVRTLRETLMVVVGPDDKLIRVELLSFAEPRDYIPRESWYAQFKGLPLDEELQLKQKVKAVTGATLTARATTSSARRMLALHKTLAAIERERLEAERKKREAEQRKRGEGPKPNGIES